MATKSTKPYTDEQIAEIHAKIAGLKAQMDELQDQAADMSRANHQFALEQDKLKARAYAVPTHHILTQLALDGAKIEVYTNYRTYKNNYKITSPAKALSHSKTVLREVTVDKLITAGYISKTTHNISGYKEYIITTTGRDQLAAWNEKYGIRHV